MKIADYLSCDPSSPSGLRWIRRKGQRGKIGGVAGHKSQPGYWCVTLDRKQVKAHRIVYFLTHGAWPASTEVIDHKNRIKYDNRPYNLCVASRSQNRQNTDMQCDNTSGCTGVTFHKQCGRWQVNINGKYIGLYGSLQDAIAARKAMEIRMFGDFAGA